MPRAGEGRSIRIDPEVYEALLTMKHGNMTFSDVIADLIEYFVNTVKEKGEQE